MSAKHLLQCMGVLVVLCYNYCWSELGVAYPMCRVNVVGFHWLFVAGSRCALLVLMRSST